MHVRRLLDRRLEGDQRVRHDPDAGPRRRPTSIRSTREPTLILSATSSSRRPASPTTATRARPPSAPRPTSSRPASATPSTSAPRPSSSCSTTSASRTADNVGSFQIDADRSCRGTPAREYEGGNLGHRPRVKGGYFPVAAGRQRCRTSAARCVSTMIEMGMPGREAPPRGGAAGQHEIGTDVRHAGRRRADRMQIYKYVVHNVAARLRQDRDLHAQADRRRQRLAACTSTSRSGRAASRCSPATATPACREMRALLHRRHHQARQGAQRLHQPDHQQLQAPGARASRRRCSSPTRRATARPRAASRTCASPKGQARRGPLPRPDGQPVPRLRRDADGRPRRHPEQDPSRATPMDKNLYDLPPAEAGEGPDRLRHRCARRSSTSTTTAPS